MDLKLDPLTNDIKIEKGDFLTVTGGDEAGQRIKDRLKTFLGEWFLNLSYGLDYRNRIFVKNPRVSIVAAHIRAEILKSVSGSITAFSTEFDNRELKVEYSVLVDKETITGNL